MNKALANSALPSVSVLGLTRTFVEPIDAALGRIARFEPLSNLSRLIVKFITRLFLRFAYSLAIRCSVVRPLAWFLPLWSVSDSIYIGPSGPSATVYPELLALRQIISHTHISDAELYAQLSHRNPWVVGYCFEALLARRSALLDALPLSLLTRQEPVSIGVACFRCFEPLHIYITHRLNAEHYGTKSSNVD